MSVGISIRRLAAAVCILWAGYLAGCVKVVPRQPNTKAVEELGVDAAKQRLQEVLTRAVDPRIAVVAVADDSLRYKWDQPIQGWYGVPAGSVQNETQIFFRNIARMEVYENNKVFVYGPGGRIDQILFPSQADAFQFHDLLESFRMRPAPPPAAAPTPANPPANP
jgi:hypothetical protein